MSAKRKGKRRGKAPSKRAMRRSRFASACIAAVPFLGSDPSHDERFAAIVLFGGYTTGEFAPSELSEVLGARCRAHVADIKLVRGISYGGIT